VKGFSKSVHSVDEVIAKSSVPRFLKLHKQKRIRKHSLSKTKRPNVGYNVGD